LPKICIFLQVFQNRICSILAAEFATSFPTIDDQLTN
jgi:hypothetical protein